MRDPFLGAVDVAAPPTRTDPFRLDPVGWADACIDWREDHLTDYQRDILGELVPQKRVSARGPHGLGKTTIAAIAVLWFATTRDAAGTDWKCPTTASAWRQLEKYLWPEIHKWAKRIRWDVVGRAPFKRGVELLDLSLKLEHGSAFAVASDDPALIEGVHADSVLYIFDESKAIIPGTFDAAEGAFAGAGEGTVAEAYAMANSTPGEPNGRFYEIHARKAGLEDWWPRHVTLEEAVDAGRVSTDWAEQRARQWGTGTAVYANRVLGEFHSSDTDGVIPLSWVEAANERWKAWDEAGRMVEGLTTVGVDVARSGSDQTVVAPRFGLVIDDLRYTHLEDTTQTTGRVSGLLDLHGGVVRLEPDVRPRAIVDVIGIGAGVFDQLRAAGYRAVAFNASEGTTRKDRSGELGFVNVRAAAWWNLREMLDPVDGVEVALPPDDMLTGDLTAPRWRVMAGGRIQVEAKDDIRKRLGRSTDSADGVVQAFWPGRGARPKLNSRASAPPPAPWGTPVVKPEPPQRARRGARVRF